MPVNQDVMDMPLKKTPVFEVGPVPVFGDLILSPMDGFSDLPFRSLCRAMGSAMSYTEFVNGLDITAGENINRRDEKKLAFLPEERPVVFQICDNDVQRILEAALRLREREPDIIDVNMGCPDRRVSGRGAGAGLLRTPLKIARIFRKLSRSLDVPITGKIRLGWDKDSKNFQLIARIIQENGGALIVVHARTKTQGYRGQADWDAIAEVKQAVSIPVIGNGDVSTVADIDRMKSHTACDGVMIGRGAIGNPWIFSRIHKERVTPEMLRDTMQRHLNLMLSFYQDDYGLVLFRKHASQYLNMLAVSQQNRQQMLTTEEPDKFLDLMNSIFLTNLYTKST